MIPADQSARETATDPSQSVLLTAPAGSGKTGVLLLRFLRCLLTVTEPEQVAAITFTKKAAAEIRERVIDALKSAHEPGASTPYEEEIRKVAAQVLAHDAQRNWSLLKNPSRLRISTFDRLCGQMARRLPLLSGLATNATADRPNTLYREACLSLFGYLEKDSADPALRDALGRVLAYANNRIETLIPLLENLLTKRDQWAEGVFQYDHEKMAAVLREDIESQYYAAATALFDLGLGEAIGAMQDMGSENDELAWALDVATSPDLDALASHRRVAAFLLSGTGSRTSVRKAGGVNVKLGFPPRHPATVRIKAALSAWHDECDIDAICSHLVALRALPSASLPSVTTGLIDDLLLLVRWLMATLRMAFEAQGVVDYTEVAFRAITALTPMEESAGQFGDALLLEDRLHHIMVDEMQDTSVNQIAFLRNLTHDWQPGDGRSVFLCGDLQQSIYLFRGAMVSEFEQLLNTKQLFHLPLTVLGLTSNFRSSPEIVSWVNSAFQPLIPQSFIEAVPYVNAAGSVTVHPTAGGTADQARAVEAQKVVSIVQHALDESPEETVTILAQSRGDLKAIIPALKDAGIPFAGQDIDPLATIPAVSDFIALVKAWWHGADRASWVSLLRSPAVGLSWDDCWAFCQPASANLRDYLMSGERDDQLSPDGQSRLAHLRQAWETISSQARCVDIRWATTALWHSLGAPAACSDNDIANIQRIMDLLGQHAPGGVLESLTAFDEAIADCYAQPAPAPVELMTIHKSKGLEFDTVIVPGLGSGGRSSDPDLFYWRRVGNHFLLAPRTPRGTDPEQAEENDLFYNYLRQKHEADESDELNRKLYVALTRAKRHLHLLGNASIRSNGDIYPPARSLLSRLWHIVGAEYQDAERVDAEDISDDVATPRRKVIDGAVNITVGPCYTTPAQEPEALDILAKAESLSAIEDNIEERAVGIVYHEIMRRLGAGHVDWVSDKDRVQRTVRARLRQHCHPETTLDDSIAGVESLVSKTLDSDHGQWILGSYSLSGVEQPIRRALGDRWEKLVIDRFFVDGDTCWVIDYKTATGSSKEFYEMQKLRYQEKMEEYRRVIAQTGLVADVRCALFFPASQALVEY